MSQDTNSYKLHYSSSSLQFYGKSIWSSDHEQLITLPRVALYFAIVPTCMMSPSKDQSMFCGTVEVNKLSGTKQWYRSEEMVQLSGWKRVYSFRLEVTLQCNFQSKASHVLSFLEQSNKHWLHICYCLTLNVHWNHPGGSLNHRMLDNTSRISVSVKIK